MKVVFTDRARQHIETRYQFGLERYGQLVADRTMARLESYIFNSLARHPDTSGNRHPVRDFYEAWVPRTPFFVVYRSDIAADTVTLLGVYHHAQDRNDIERD